MQHTSDVIVIIKRLYSRDYVDNASGWSSYGRCSPALGGLTDPQRRRVSRKTTTQTAATASSRAGVGSPPLVAPQRGREASKPSTHAPSPYMLTSVSRITLHACCCGPLE